MLLGMFIGACYAKRSGHDGRLVSEKRQVCFVMSGEVVNVQGGQLRTQAAALGQLSDNGPRYAKDTIHAYPERMTGINELDQVRRKFQDDQFVDQAVDPDAI